MEVFEEERVLKICQIHFAAKAFHGLTGKILNEDAIPTLCLDPCLEVSRDNASFDNLNPTQYSINNETADHLNRTQDINETPDLLIPYKTCSQYFFHNGKECRSFAVQTTRILAKMDPDQLKLKREIKNLKDKVRYLKTNWIRPEILSPTTRKIKNKQKRKELKQIKLKLNKTKAATNKKPKTVVPKKSEQPQILVTVKEEKPEEDESDDFEMLMLKSIIEIDGVVKIEVED